MRLTPEQRLKKYGNPMGDQVSFERANMILLDIPDDINKAIKAIPNRVYCNKVIADPLVKSLRRCISAGVHTEIQTWDGCFNVRKKRGSNAISMHSWGLAIDMNAAWNPLVKNVTPINRASLRKKYVRWSEKFLDCWRAEGWECGADWITRLDGMHIEWPY